VRFIDDEQAHACSQERQDFVAEAWIVEPLGAHEQHVDRAALDLGLRFTHFRHASS